jgi:hypothetical protein
VICSFKGKGQRCVWLLPLLFAFFSGLLPDQHVEHRAMSYSKTVRSGVNLEPLCQYSCIGCMLGSSHDGLLCGCIEEDICNGPLPPSLLPWKSWPRDHRGSQEQPVPQSLACHYQHRRLKPMSTIDAILTDV